MKRSLTVNPYIDHNDVLIHCDIVNRPNIDELFFVLITFDIVDNGEEHNIINNIDAYIPSASPNTLLTELCALSILYLPLVRSQGNNIG